MRNKKFLFDKIERKKNKKNLKRDIYIKQLESKLNERLISNIYLYEVEI